MQANTITFEFHDGDEFSIAAGAAKISFSGVSQNVDVKDAKLRVHKHALNTEIILKKVVFPGSFLEKANLECINVFTSLDVFRIYVDSDWNSEGDNIRQHTWINDYGNICLAVGEYSEDRLQQLHKKLNFDFK